MERQINLISNVLAIGGAIYTATVFSLSFLFPEKRPVIYAIGFSVAGLLSLIFFTMNYFNSKFEHLESLQERINSLEESLKLDTRLRNIEEKLIKQECEVSSMKISLHTRKGHINVYIPLIIAALSLIAFYIVFVLILRNS